MNDYKRIDGRELDRHITGNYGEDQLRGENEELMVEPEAYAALATDRDNLEEALREIFSDAEACMEGAGLPDFDNYARIANAARSAIARKQSR